MASVAHWPCAPSTRSAVTAASSGAAPVHLAWHRSSTSSHTEHVWVQRLGIVEREHSAWGHYLRTVYGPAVPLPFDLRRLRWFWWWAPGASNITRLEMPVWRHPLPGEAWVPGLRTERHLAFAGFFIRPPSTDSELRAGGKAAAAQSRVESIAKGSIEVMRVSHPSSESTQSAFGPEAAAHDQVWYWHAPGSGIFLSPGRSLAVDNRSALLAHLAAMRTPRSPTLGLRRVKMSRERGLRLCDGCSTSDDEVWHDFEVLWWRAQSTNGPRVCDAIRLAGYDTVQFTRAFGGLRHEIIDCRRAAVAAASATAAAATSLDKPEAAATAACPPEGSRSNLLHLTANAVGACVAANCECSDAQTFLNCGTCVGPNPGGVLRAAQPGVDKWVELRAPNPITGRQRASTSSTQTSGE